MYTLIDCLDCHFFKCIVEGIKYRVQDDHWNVHVVI